MLLSGKTILIVGLANKHSIAYGVAKSAYENGARLLFTYQNESIKKRVEPIAKEFGSEDIFEFDASKEENFINLRDAIKERVENIDGLLHSIAFAPRAALSGATIDTKQDDFLVAMNISVYSLIGLSNVMLPIMNQEGSIITLSYYGAEKYIPQYNVMGIAKAALESAVRYLAVDLGEKNIRINAISAGPIKTLAANGIKDFKKLMKWNEEHSPLNRNVTTDEVGKSATFLFSEYSRGITGQTIYVDSGYSIIGMPKNEG